MRIISRQSVKQQRRLSDRLSEVPYIQGEKDLKQRYSGRFLPDILGKTFGHPSSGVVGPLGDKTTEKGGLYARIESDLAGCEATSDEVLKIVEDLRQEGNFTEDELERLKLYLMSVEYNKGYMEDAVLLHENNPQYSVEEFYQFILDN
ncbi:hypothetical protein [uncultured Sphaerochaeta sp.]|jgi:hypothetical protein|uniref:hypothetical protein n=1 Tax=uncultured Sphaerochaeta sp. TaxID=886478 RepID=UPI00263A16A2|nr:hypothetical protein [uncultured Sphaerochaeta sp.]